MRFLLLLGALVGSFAAVGGASAQPSLPATFFGSVTVDGKPAEAGVEVRGLIDGRDCTQAQPGERPVFRDEDTAAYVLYVVHETQRPGCARDGSTVTFTIAGRTALQTAPWKAGPIHLDLSVGEAPPIPLPSPTGTLAAAVATVLQETPQPGGSALTPVPRPTGTPPTDDVTLPSGVLGPAVGVDKGDGGGSSVVVVVVVVLAVLALGGGAVGVWLSRRNR